MAQFKRLFVLPQSASDGNGKRQHAAMEEGEQPQECPARGMGTGRKSARARGKAYRRPGGPHSPREPSRIAATGNADNV